MGTPLGRTLTIAKMTFQETVGSGRALVWIFVSALLFALMTFMMAENGDATVVVFTWSAMVLMYLFVCFMAAGGLREQLAGRTLAPIITAPLTRPEYVTGRFLGIWVPGWITISIGYWFLFTYGVVRTEGMKLLRGAERMANQAGELPEGLGMLAQADLALYGWILFSAFLLAITAALFALSSVMGRIASLIVCFMGWNVIGFTWRWKIPAWATAGASTSQMDMATFLGEWPSLPQPISIGAIMFSGTHASGLTLLFVLQSVGWAALFLLASYLAFGRQDLSRPQ